jgi:Fe2+ or Zn2+ uptake regulation protein
MPKSKAIDPVVLLKDAGFKNTPVRRALLLALSTATTPLTVRQLVRKVRATKADTATVYRALEAFEAEALVRSMQLTKNNISYELSRVKHSHHITCTNCAAVEVIPFCVKGIGKNALKTSRRFKTVVDHRLSFLGTCKNCARTVR